MRMHVQTRYAGCVDPVVIAWRSTHTLLTTRLTVLSNIRMTAPQGDAYVTITRLYADATGESHFGTWEWPAVETEFAPPAPPVFVTAPEAAERTLLLRIPAGWYGQPHPAPRRQLMVVVKGTLESATSDGETRLFPAGSAVLVEDTTGPGHSTRTVDGEVVVAVTQLDGQTT
jgi:hypothetical protein